MCVGFIFFKVIYILRYALEVLLSPFYMAYKTLGGYVPKTNAIIYFCFIAGVAALAYGIYGVLWPLFMNKFCHGKWGWCYEPFLLLLIIYLVLVSFLEQIRFEF